jgi:hypothetical protein
VKAILSVANKFCCCSKYCLLTIQKLITAKIYSSRVERFYLVGLGRGILLLPINRGPPAPISITCSIPIPVPHTHPATRFPTTSSELPLPCSVLAATTAAMAAANQLSALLNNMYATVRAFLRRTTAWIFVFRCYSCGIPVVADEIALCFGARVCWTSSSSSCRCSRTPAPLTSSPRSSRSSARTARGSSASSPSCCKFDSSLAISCL